MCVIGDSPFQHNIFCCVLRVACWEKGSVVLPLLEKIYPETSPVDRNAAETMPIVLVTGGSGYLGKCLVQGLSKNHEVFYTFTTTPVELPGKGFKVDFVSGDGLKACFEDIGHVDVVVNCAAIASPGACEKDPERARAINVPSRLIDCMSHCKSTKGGQPILIHLSTDQVYDGSKNFWSESDEAHPINVYGKTKIEAELFIQSKWSNHVILRSSIIWGKNSTMLDFIVNSLMSGKPAKFFQDEYRCPIFILDILQIVEALIKAEPAEMKQRLFNMGGPDRLSRVDMAKLVAARCQLDASLIEEVPSASVPRGVASPLDISMDITRLKGLGVPLTPFSATLEQIFPEGTQ